MRILSSVILVSFIAVSFSRDLWACVCACRSDIKVEQEIADAAMIVLARVVSTKPKSTDPDPNDEIVEVSSCGEQWVQVSIQETLKGTPTPKISFVRANVGTGCDFKFPLRVGDAYLFFAFKGKSDDNIHISGCSPSLPESSASDVLEKVRKQIGEVSQHPDEADDG